MTSMFVQRLPKVDKEAWQLHTHADKDIQPPKALFEFLRTRISMVDTSLPEAEFTNKGGESKPEARQEHRRRRKRTDSS